MVYDSFDGVKLTKEGVCVKTKTKESGSTKNLITKVVKKDMKKQ